MKFSYKNPTHIEFGEGKISKLNKLISKDKKILFVYGGGSIKKNGVYNQVIEALSGFDFIEFSGVEPNPTKETLDCAISLAKENSIDFILGVGGGSVIDGCKYIAATLSYGKDGWDILEGKHIVKSAIDIGAILTLAATGSESNGGSVITKKETKEKRFFSSFATYPKFAILDPSVLRSLDEKQLANGLVDTFVHVCEQYLTYPQNALVQDFYSLALLKTIVLLAQNFNHRDDFWYNNLMWASNQGLNGLIGSGVEQDWATHFIGHHLSGLYNIDHARTLAIIQPSLLKEMIEYKTEKLITIGKEVFDLNSQNPNETIENIENLYKSLGIKLKISDYTDDKNVIEKIKELLTKHNMTKIGEGGKITLDIVEKILFRSL